MQAIIRTYKLALEARLGADIPEDHVIMGWLVKHAAANRNRFHIGKDGMTALRRLKGRSFNKKITEFGESVWYLKPKSVGKEKLRTRWATGIWLGVRDESNEIFIGTEEGVIKVRTVRRKGTHEERWNTVQIDRMKGTPWEPQPGRNSIEVGSKIIVHERGDNREVPELPVGVPRPVRKTRFKILRQDVVKYGPTEECEGCRSAMTNGVARNHSEECRDRLAQLLMADGDARVMRDVDRDMEQEELARELIRPDPLPVAKPEELESEEVDMDDSEEPPEPMLMEGEIMRLGVPAENEDDFRKMHSKATKITRNWRDDVDKMHKVLERDGISAAVIDIKSDDRIDAINRLWELLPGWSLDLTAADPDDGEPWDFTRQDKRDKAERLVKEKSALLLIGSPMCSALSMKQKVAKKCDDMDHSRFLIKLYKMQIDNGDRKSVV